MGDMQEMVKYLGLTDKPLWDLALYWIFLINLVVLFMQPDGSTFTTLLSIFVLVSAAIDKTYGFGYMLDPGRYTPEYFHEKVFIGTYLIRVVMFVAPLAIAGSTNNPKSRGVAILAGISGAVYMFGRWFVDQRNVDNNDVGLYIHFTVLPQTVGMLLVLARVALRGRLALGTVHRDIPVTVPGIFATDDIEI